MVIQTRREKLREATVAEIKAVAKKQMQAQGAAGISLRAIAAEMGLTAPALYGYFKNRDDLVTALIVDGYYALAEALKVTSEQYGDDPARAAYEVLLTYRQWALDNPADFSLLFGTPIPGYQAPPEITIPAAQAGMQIIMLTLQKAYEQANPQTPLSLDPAAIPETVSRQLTEWGSQRAGGLNLALAYMSIVGWSVIQGMITLEVFGHLQFILTDPAELYKYEMLQLLKRLGISPEI